MTAARAVARGATAASLLSSLPPIDGARAGVLAAAATERDIDYKLGSAEAEEVALLSGLKPLIRQFLRPDALDRSRARFAARGLHVVEAAATFLDPPHPGRVLYAGRDADRVAAAVRADTTTDMERDLGLLLGYPACCVERFLELRPPRRNVDLLRLALGATASDPRPRLNVCDLGVFHYLSWTPCAFDCAASLAYADQVAWQIAYRHGQALERPDAPPALCPPGCGLLRFVARIDEALGAHRLVVLEDVQVSLVGRLAAGVLHVERAWPTARDRHPRAGLDGAALSASARVADLVAGRRLAIDGDTLLGDGQPLLRSGDLMLVAFGGRA